jgi:hypothetical protein
MSFKRETKYAFQKKLFFPLCLVMVSISFVIVQSCTYFILLV